MLLTNLKVKYGVIFFAGVIVCISLYYLSLAIVGYHLYFLIYSVGCSFPT